MPALATVVTNYLTAVKSSLQQGSDLGSNVRGAALNYLRAQDMATVLDLLQDALDQSTPLTAIAGSTSRSVRDGIGTFVNGQQVGNIVVFSGNVTAALAGVEARVISNSDRELFFASGVLPATPASGDTYTIRGGVVDVHIADLREGKSRGDAPAGSLYGESQVALDGLLMLRAALGQVEASGTLTLSGNAGNTQTVTIGSKVYTFQTTLTDVDGNVLIGAAATDSIDNLIAAIVLGSGAGTLYATSTTLHPTVYATVGAGDTMLAFAKTAGTAGNSIATTETLASGSWGAATLTGGAAVDRLTSRVMASLVTSTGSTTSSLVLNLRGGTLRIDELRHMRVTVAGESRYVVSNTEAGVLTLSAPLTSAPGGAVAVSVEVDEAAHGRVAVPKSRVHAGGQPGDNRVLADLIDRAQTAVIAYTLPT